MVKNLPAIAGDTGLIPGLGRSPGEGNGKSHGQRSLVGYVQISLNAGQVLFLYANLSFFAS